MAAGLAFGMLSLLTLAQTIPNPSFELNSFTTFPGYTGPENGQITGWNATTGSGLNPAGGSPFADNGTVPNGSQVAFVQTGSIDTVITGLTSGKVYKLAFRVNARNGQNPILDVQVDGTTLLASVVNSVGGTNPYRYVAVEFTATGATATLTLANTQVPDTTFVVDDFTIAESKREWKAEAWNDDATSGVDRAFVYTHAYNFGSSENATINGVRFTGVAGGNPSVSGKFTTTGLDGIIGADANNVVDDGGSRTLANTFVYNGFPTTLTLQGLTPAREYELTIFSVNWDGGGNRWGTFRSGNDQASFDQDAFGDNNGIRFVYRYTADASGTAVIRTHPIQNASIHWYGFANREAVAVPTPSIVSQPVSTVGTIGDTVTFYGSASGTPEPSYQWLRNNTPIAGATSQTLTVSVAGVGDIGNYTLRATNASGTATSSPAFLEVYEALAGLFSTGVDAAGAVLADGEIDPHYKLINNPDAAGVTDAFVQDSTVFPIVAGPWVANTDKSKWIGPRTETSGAAGPVAPYTYQTTFDLTGKPLTFTLTGRYSVDNTGTSVRLNDVALAAVPQSTGFAAYTPFSIASENLPAGSISNGVNKLAFDVVNAGAGYTGLRVDGLKVIFVPAGVAPVIRTQPKGGGVTSGTAVTLTSKAYGSGPLSYQWLRNNTPINGATSATYTIPSFSQALNGDYTVKVTNTSGNVTSEVATLSALNVPAFIVTAPQPQAGGLGESVTFSVVADGSAPIAYQWLQNNNAIPNATGSSLTINPIIAESAGNYAVRVSNSAGTNTSATVSLTIGLRGIYDTGVDNARVVLPDGAADPHYRLIVNPDGTNDVPAIVHSSTVFPISTGNWLANNSISKWISPVVNTAASVGEDVDAGEGGGVYVYRLVVDTTGFDPATISISGGWASDNTGRNIRVNGQDTGLINTVQFPSLTAFTIDTNNATFVSGTNTIDFLVQNQTATPGPTGLRVQGLRGVGTLIPRLTLSLSFNATKQPVVSFTGASGTQYRVQRSTTLLPAGWTTVQTSTPNANGPVQYTDTNPDPVAAYYRVLVGP